MTEEVKDLGGGVFYLGDGVYELRREYGCNGFIFPSGDGYEKKEIISKLDFIENYTGKEATLYCGLGYEDIPFKEIYAFWNEDPENMDRYKVPTKEEFNFYDHGFFHVLV